MGRDSTKPAYISLLSNCKGNAMYKPPLSKSAVNNRDEWLVINKVEQRIAESHYSESGAEFAAEVLNDHSARINGSAFYVVVHKSTI